jgi:hypothetical protein
MKLSNVGNLVQFALDLEAMTSAFYETATTITQTQELKSLFEALIMKGQSSLQTLIQLRRKLSLVDVQGTFPGLESERYRPKTECPPGCPDEQLIQTALTMEQQVIDFYQDSSVKLGFVDELPDIFDQLAEYHAQNRKELQTIGSAQNIE